MTSWNAVIAAVGVALGGEHDRGRADLLACWQEAAVGEHGQRCVRAHYLADCQGDLGEEVAWDERALAAHAHLSSGDLVAVGIPDAAGLAATGVLAQDGYGAMIRAGLEGLRSRLADTADGAAPARRP